MEIERKIVCLPVDANLQAEVSRLAAEGWQFLEGVPPVAVYHLAREKPATVLGIGKMTIDEDKVFIMDKDGNIRKS